MSVFKCKMCGGTIEFNEGATVGVCDSCGTKQTLPRLDDDRRANLYDRANHFRRNNDYDKAASIYEQILTEDTTDAEAYWSLVLCQYGIEYVEDPATHKRVPTVNRAQFTSIFDDDNYKSAIQYADGYQRAIYEEEATAINEIQKGILAISQKEEPFDVFICYKETDNSGRRTPDSVLANELYHQLIQEGFKVFFSRITLEDKLGTAYEPYIFAALNSAKVMVVLGTKPEHFNAVWIKNEWSRYLALVKQSGGKKILIPAYRDMDPYDLPEEFSHLQAQDMSKLGFMQDLIRGIKKVCGDNRIATASPNTTPENNTSTILDRAFICLEAKEWRKAYHLFEEALKINPRLSDAYLGKCMVDLHITNKDSIVKHRKVLKNKNFNLATKFANEYQKNELQRIVAKVQEDLKKRKAKTIKRFKNISKICLISILCISIVLGGYMGYTKLIYPEIQYSQANKLLDNEEYDKAINKYKALNSYRDSKEKIKEALYLQGKSLFEKSNYTQCAKYFSQIKDYKDSSTYLQKEEVFYRTKGNIVTLGTYEQDNNLQNGKEKIEWIILDPEYDVNSVMLISKQCIDYKMYDDSHNYAGIDEDEYYNQLKDSVINWEDCTLRSWLNNSFYNDTFTFDEKARLQNIEATNDKVSILSAEEAEKLFVETVQMSTGCTKYAHQRLIDTHYNGKENIYNRYNEDYIVDYWLRKTERCDTQDIVIAASHIANASIVEDRGEIQKDGALSMSPVIAVRPIIILSLD